MIGIITTFFHMIVTKNLSHLIPQYLPDNSVIVEAGAFNGRDSIELAAKKKDTTIHAFEPVPEIFAELKKNTAVLSNIHCYEYALSNTTGISHFYVSEHPKKPGKICQAGTLLKPKDRLLKSPIHYPRIIDVKTITLDEWAAARGITNVDFLWLDMQGNELAALQGARSLLKTVGLLYVEVNFIEAYEKQPLALEVNNWIIKEGFSPIARDFHESPEWFFGNILFARK
jgi:FkbM family methyltransferase